jgi:hypothetical protein
MIQMSGTDFSLLAKNMLRPLPASDNAQASRAGIAAAAAAADVDDVEVQ